MVATVAVVVGAPVRADLAIGLGAYLVFIVLSWVLRGRFALVGWIGPIVGATAVAVLGLVVALPLPIWVLLVFPLAEAATLSRVLTLGVGLVGLVGINVGWLIGADPIDT